jgi:hypothetical protein
VAEIPQNITTTILFQSLPSICYFDLVFVNFAKIFGIGQTKNQTLALM